MNTPVNDTFSPDNPKYANKSNAFKTALFLLSKTDVNLLSKMAARRRALNVWREKYTGLDRKIAEGYARLVAKFTPEKLKFVDECIEIIAARPRRIWKGRPSLFQTPAKLLEWAHLYHQLSPASRREVFQRFAEDRGQV
jgi:hypothetical protein